MTQDVASLDVKNNSDERMARLLTLGVMSELWTRVNMLIESESREKVAAYIHFMSQMQNRESPLQELNSFYDTIFFIADSIEQNTEGDWTIQINTSSLGGGFVRLNKNIPAEIPTIPALRNKETSGILFSWVGMLSILTKSWERVYPLIHRDENAPSDPGKFTLPAGRCDKTPWATVYEEIIEELVLFWKKDGKIYMIIPDIDNEVLSRTKVIQLAEIARYKYLNSLIQKNGVNSLDWKQWIIGAPLYFAPVQELWWWKKIRTVFHHDWVFQKETEESGFYPVHDEKNNTYEMVKRLDMDVTEFDEIYPGDGDGFGRDVFLCNRWDVESFVDAGKCVYSLEWAVQKWCL